MMKLHALLFVTLAALPPAMPQASKKRVAVLDFEYGTVYSGISAIFGTHVDVGKGIADLLVERMVKDGVYSVVERKALDKILAEQNFSNSDRADPTSAAKIGRILGVDAIIMGSITQFGRDDKSVGVAGGALNRTVGGFGIGGLGRKEAKAVVGISARMVDTSTAEIRAAATGKGESKRGGVSLVGAGGASGTSVGGAGNMTSSNFAATILGEATSQAVTGVATQLEAASAGLPDRQVTIDGVVADVSGATLVLNIGSKAGLRVGHKLEVKRKDREIRDPATDRVIRVIETKLGDLTITEVDELSAVGTFSGSGPVKVGDAVKSPR